MKPKVVIIGAGASGLYACYCLVTRGLTENIIILEAEDRVGGRIHTIPYNGHWLELGATWIHGRGENLLWKFVEEKQVKSKGLIFFFRICRYLLNKHLFNRSSQEIFCILYKFTLCKLCVL